jgi:hypothetical protein
MTYNVSLMLAEPKFQASGQRVFDVKINGQTMRMDICQQAGYNTAWKPTFTSVAAPDGLIDVYFAPVIDKAIVSGIIVEAVPNSIEEGKSERGSPGLGFGVFPNPFNGTTNLSYSLPRAGDVRLEVFDILGRRVSSLYLGYQEKGEHSLRWTADDLASGAYVCFLSAGDQVRGRHILLVK